MADDETDSGDDQVAVGTRVAIRRVRAGDLATIAENPYSVSILEPHSDLARLQELFDSTGLWLDESAAVAIVELASSRMVGTVQAYRSAPCIHGLELGYIIHDPADRARRFAGEAVRLFSDYLFARPDAFFRQQLIIEVWNTPSWKVAERAGFVREGILRSAGFGQGDPADAFVYSRTRKDVGQESASHNGPA